MHLSPMFEKSYVHELNINNADSRQHCKTLRLNLVKCNYHQQ